MARRFLDFSSDDPCVYIFAPMSPSALQKHLKIVRTDATVLTLLACFRSVNHADIYKGSISQEQMEEKVAGLTSTGYDLDEVHCKVIAERSRRPLAHVQRYFEYSGSLLKDLGGPGVRECCIL